MDAAAQAMRADQRQEAGGPVRSEARFGAQAESTALQFGMPGLTECCYCFPSSLVLISKGTHRMHPDFSSGPGLSMFNVLTGASACSSELGPKAVWWCSGTVLQNELSLSCFLSSSFYNISHLLMASSSSTHVYKWFAWKRGEDFQVSVFLRNLLITT